MENKEYKSRTLDCLVDHKTGKAITIMVLEEFTEKLNEVARIANESGARISAALKEINQTN